MNKKIIMIIPIIVLLIGLVIGIIYRKNYNYIKTDSYKFKKEYESLNNKENDYGKTYKSVSIDRNNRIIYSTAKEIVEKTENKETFIVYFGFNKCPWCRSMVENLVDLSIENNMDIYYVDVLDIRDTIEVVEGNLKTTKDGDEYYMKLIELYGNVLDEYIVYNGEDSINTGEKRIYAPNVIAIINGKAEEKVEGISEELEDPYGTITKKMNEQSIKQLKCIFKCISEAGICTNSMSC